MENAGEVKKVRVFAAYQLGTGPDAKMIGGESENRFEVTLGATSAMMLEIEAVLSARHAEAVAKGLIPLIHRYELISF
ncbi:MAG: hypothetical protein WC791_01975 [Candidatus Paceibacterota bacterium]|jgi:hypothetical protein